MCFPQEPNSSYGSNNRQSAIRIKNLPAGTIKFETLIEEGLTGVVTKEPPPSLWITRSPTKNNSLVSLYVCEKHVFKIYSVIQKIKLNHILSGDEVFMFSNCVSIYEKRRLTNIIPLKTTKNLLKFTMNLQNVKLAYFYVFNFSVMCVLWNRKLCYLL